MTINHSNCDHPRTSSGRARCRRGASPQSGASVKTVNFAKIKKASTPRDRDKQCDVCGVEKIEWRGTDPLDGIMKYVGDKCFYIVKRSDDLIAHEGSKF